MQVLTDSADLASTVIGTPYYMSPELCESAPYNDKSDVWALGCVLYELATLNHAFDATNMCALVLAILRGKYPPIDTRYSAELRDLVTQMLQADVSWLGCTRQVARCTRGPTYAPRPRMPSKHARAHRRRAAAGERVGRLRGRRRGWRACP